MARYHDRMRTFFLLILAGGALLAQAPAPVKRAAPAPAATPVKPAAPTPAATPAKPAGAAASADKIVLSIGDEKMTAAQFEAFVDTLPEQYRAAIRGPEKRQLIEQLANLKMLAQEARRRKVDQSPAFKAQLLFQTESLLAGTMFRELSTSLKVAEADSRKYYDDHKSEYERVSSPYPYPVQGLRSSRRGQERADGRRSPGEG